jgi:hypothetical protein
MKKCQPKVATIALTRGYPLRKLRSYRTLILRNKAIRRHFSAKVSPEYDTVHRIFHEGNIPFFHQALIRLASLPLRLEFVNVKEFFEDFARKSRSPVTANCPETPLSARFSVGYKTMCAFWVNGFLKYTADFDVVFRIDEDCEVLAGDFRDVVEKLLNKDVDYAVPYLQGPDNPDVTRGLAEFAEIWHSEHPETTPPSVAINPYTNIFALRLDAVRSNGNILSFLHAVSETGCISRNRWGDLPVWGALLSLYKNDLRLAVRPDIHYRHGSHGTIIRDSSKLRPPRGPVA